MKGVIASRRLWEQCAGERRFGVLGIFSSAVYLRDDSGLVLMLHDSRYGSLPFGVAVPNIRDRARDLGIDADSTLILESRQLHCGGFRLELELCPAADISVPRRDRAALRELAADIRSALERDGRATLLALSSWQAPPASGRELEDPFAGAGLEGVALLRSALDRGSAQELDRALDRLLGLGRGLTPSFDDFLCGLCFCLDRLAGELPISKELKRALTEKADARTNSFSAAYLTAAASGEDLSLLRELLCSGSGEPRRAATEAMLRVGSSSGADMLSGLLFALNFILKRSDFTSP